MGSNKQVAAEAAHLGSRYAVLQEDGMEVEHNGEHENMAVHADGNAKGTVSSVGAVGVQQPISKNATYMAFNPDKRGKCVGANGKGNDQVKVVVLEPESMPHIERHTVVQGGGSHTVVKILDTSGVGKAQSKSKASGSGFKVDKPSRDIVSKGLQVKSKSDNQMANNLVISDWVQTATDRIDSMVSDLSSGREGIGVMEEDDPGDPTLDVTATVSKEGGDTVGFREAFSHGERLRL
ncbi:hypothetical protein V6N13_059189 [Hibiscus sabdariffa]